MLYNIFKELGALKPLVVHRMLYKRRKRQKTSESQKLKNFSKIERKKVEKTKKMENPNTKIFTPKPWNQPMNMSDIKSSTAGKELYLQIVQFQIQHGRK